MKIKKVLFILLFIFVLVLTAGCSSKGNTGGETVPAASQSEKVTIPERAPDLMGRVAEIIGNEVTIFRIEGNFGQRAAGGEGQRPNTDTPNSNLPQNSDNPAQQGSEQATAQGSESGTGNRMPQITVSEEKEALIIPVGTPIVTVERGSTQVNVVGLTEIKKNQIIRVWKNEDTVEFVQLMAAAGGRGNGAGSGQNPGQGGFPGAVIFGPGGMGGGPR